MKIAASIVFDSAYVECALVTAHEVSQCDAAFDALNLVYVNRGTAEDAAVRLLIADFATACRGPVAIHAIEVGNLLPDFQSHHFNNSIVYKPLVPALLPGNRFILNLDAGILLGNQFNGYVTEVVETLCTPDASWVIAANTSAAEVNLLPAQLRLPHHQQYADGAVLLFNAWQYAASEWSARYCAKYAELHAGLRYAEQELISLVAMNEELVDLPRKDQLKFGFLGEKVLNRSCAPLPESVADDCVYFKFKGSIKPWKYWVLDPDKAIYTRRRERLERHFRLAGHPVIESHRESCPRSDWAATYLKLYDEHLVSAADGTGSDSHP